MGLPRGDIYHARRGLVATNAPAGAARVEALAAEAGGQRWSNRPQSEKRSVELALVAGIVVSGLCTAAQVGGSPIDGLFEMRYEGWITETVL